MADSELKYPKWQNPCVDALMELDPRKILERVSVAEAEIYARFRKRETSSDVKGDRMKLPYDAEVP
jgi:hypothetical protein